MTLKMFIFFPLCSGKDKGSGSCHVVSFELSCIGTLSSYWGHGLDSATGERQQREQELHCNRAKMILLDAPESHLKDYVKLRYNYN